MWQESNFTHWWRVCIWPRKKQIDQLYLWKVLQGISHPDRRDFLFIFKNSSKCAFCSCRIIYDDSPPHSSILNLQEFFGSAPNPSVHLFCFSIIKYTRTWRSFLKMEKISASRSHPFFSKGTKCMFARSSSSSLVAPRDMTGGVITSCPTFQNAVLYVSTWEISLKSDSSLLHIYHRGTIKIRKQQEVILLGKAQSSPSDYHPLLGPTLCLTCTPITVLFTLMAIIRLLFYLPGKGSGCVLLIFVCWALRVWPFDFFSKCLLSGDMDE